MNENINALVEAEVERRLSDPVYLREANQRLIEKVQRLERGTLAYGKKDSDEKTC